MEPEKLYAVEYKYGKESPFTYSESKRFIIETPENNGFVNSNILNDSINQTNKSATILHKQWPIKLIIQNINLYIKKKITKSKIIDMELKKSSQFFENTTNVNNISNKIDKNFYSLYIIMQLEQNFFNFKIGINLEPFCEFEKTANYSINNANKINDKFKYKNNQDKISINSEYFFWLSREQPYRILQHLDVLSAICLSNFSHVICNNFKKYKNINKKCNSSLFCYTPTILLNKKLFSMNKYCINLANYVSTEITKKLFLNKFANATKSISNFVISLNFSKILLLIYICLTFYILRL